MWLRGVGFVEALPDWVEGIPAESNNTLIERARSVFLSSLSGRGRGRPVVHHDRTKEEHRAQLPCGGQQQARSRRLHGGHYSPHAV